MDLFSSYVLVAPLSPQGRGCERGAAFCARPLLADGAGGAVRLQRFGEQAALGERFLRGLVNDAKRRLAARSSALLQTVEIASCGGELYAISELERGVDVGALLDAFARTNARPPFDFAIALAVALLELSLALDGATLVLRPTDVVLTPEGRVQLRALGRLRAQPHLLAPELRRKEATGERTAVWAVGRLLRCLLAGTVAPQTRPKVPGEHAAATKPILAGMLATDPGQRPTALDALAALTTFMHALEIQEAEPRVAKCVRPLFSSLSAQRAEAEQALTAVVLEAARRKIKPVPPQVHWSALESKPALDDVTQVRPPGSSVSSDVFVDEGPDSAELSAIGVPELDALEDDGAQTEVLTPDVIAAALDPGATGAELPVDQTQAIPVDRTEILSESEAGKKRRS